MTQEAGKGSAPRKNLVPQAEVDNNWDNIFKKTAPQLSKDNKDNIKSYTDCGCYFCLTVFEGKDITDWTDKGQTALCPRCDMDTVLPKVKDMVKLKEEHVRWFCVTEGAKAFDEPIVSTSLLEVIVEANENPPEPRQALINGFKKHISTKIKDEGSNSVHEFKDI